MKVKELIKTLLEHPMDSEIKVSDKSNTLEDIHYIHNNKLQGHIEIMTYKKY